MMLFFISRILCVSVFAAWHKQINVIKSESLKRGSERASVLRFYFTTQREREEKEEPGRVIRDSFHPHHKDRLQAGSFGHPKLHGSTDADGAFPTTQYGAEIGGGAHQRLCAVKAQRNTFVFIGQSSELAETHNQPDRSITSNETNTTQTSTRSTSYAALMLMLIS